MDDDDDNDGIDDEVEDWNKRNVKVTESESIFIIESRANYVDRKDKVKFEVEYNDEGVGIKVKFSSESADDDNSSNGEDIIKISAESGVELQFKVKFRNIIEYLDDNDNGIYDKNADTLVQEYEINTYKPLVHTETNENGVIMHIFDLSTADGVFSLKIYFTQEFAIIEDNTLIAPSQTKFDIKIENFTYQETTSKLALYTKHILMKLKSLFTITPYLKEVTRRVNLNGKYF